MNELIMQAQRGETEAIQKIVAGFHGLIVKNGKRYEKLFGSLDEAMAVVTYTLVEGIYTYDPSQGRTVAHHFVICISNRMVRERRAAAKRNQCCEEPRVNPELDPLAERMDQLPDAAQQTPEERYIQHEEQQILWHLVAELPGLERQIIQLRYCQQCTYQEIGSRLGISRKRASSLHEKARASLEHLFSTASQPVAVAAAQKRRFS